jgi:putative nucleotidyltransferase with HDIG domain
MAAEHSRTAVLAERREGGGLASQLPPHRPAPLAAEPIDTAAFNFMKALASDLHLSRLQLPSPPDVAIKIRQALASNRTNLEHVRRVVGADPVLVGRLIASANSAATLGTEPVGDVKSAILKLGLNFVHSVAMIVSLRHVLDAQVPAVLRDRLKAEWRHAIRVATIAQVLARNLTSVDAHKAHLAGLLHGIGRLYILRRAKEYPALLGSEGALDLVMGAWHHEVGAALAKHWGLAEEICAAVRDYESYDLHCGAPPSFTMLICLANRIAAGMVEGAELPMPPPAFLAILGISATGWLAVARDVRDELDHLQQALGLE